MAKFDVNKIITESLQELKGSNEDEVLNENISDIAKDLSTPAGMAKKAKEKLDIDAAKAAQEKADNVPQGENADAGILAKGYPHPNKEQMGEIVNQDKAVKSNESYQAKVADKETINKGTEEKVVNSDGDTSTKVGKTIDKAIEKTKETLDAGIVKAGKLAKGLTEKAKEATDSGIEHGKKVYKTIEDMPTQQKVIAGGAIAAGLGALALAKKLRNVKKASSKV